MKVEDRLDYYDVLENEAVRMGSVYRCKVCGTEIGAIRDRTNLLDRGARPNIGNARGAMTNHLKGHMRRGEV